MPKRVSRVKPTPVSPVLIDLIKPLLDIFSNLESNSSDTDEVLKDRMLGILDFMDLIRFMRLLLLQLITINLSSADKNARRSPCEACLLNSYTQILGSPFFVSGLYKEVLV